MNTQNKMMSLIMICLPITASDIWFAIIRFISLTLLWTSNPIWSVINVEIKSGEIWHFCLQAFWTSAASLPSFWDKTWGHCCSAQLSMASMLLLTWAVRNWLISADTCFNFKSISFALLAALSWRAERRYLELSASRINSSASSI